MKYLFASLTIILFSSMGYFSLKTEKVYGDHNAIPSLNIKSLKIDQEPLPEFKTIDPSNFKNFKSFKNGFLETGYQQGYTYLKLEKGNFIYTIYCLDCFKFCYKRPPVKARNIIHISENSAQTGGITVPIEDWNSFFLEHYAIHGKNPLLSQLPHKVLITVDFMEETNGKVVEEHLLKLLEAFDYAQEHTSEKLKLNLNFQKEFCLNPSML